MARASATPRVGSLTGSKPSRAVTRSRKSPKPRGTNFARNAAACARRPAASIASIDWRTTGSGTPLRAVMTAGTHWRPVLSHAWLVGLEHPAAARVRAAHHQGPDTGEHLSWDDNLVMSRREGLVRRKLRRPVRTRGRVRSISADGSPVT